LQSQPLTMYTTRWCGDCQRAKNFLTKFAIPFVEVDIEQDPEAAAYVQSVNGGRRSVPTLVVGNRATSLSGFTREKFDAFVAQHGLLGG
jgi:mycoredoxin